MKKINLGMLLNEQVKLGRKWSPPPQKKNTDQSWRKLHREEKRFEDTLTDEMVEENCKNLSRLLKLT
jgi:hypothetical protein